MDSCNHGSLKVYRTFAEDARCKPLKFLPSNSTVKKAVLLSFPGSGNTWVRHMIEQASGIYTGSVYGSPQLLRSGQKQYLPCQHKFFQKNVVPYGHTGNLNDV